MDAVDATEHCGDEHHQRRVWRVEVGDQPVADLEGVAGRDAKRSRPADSEAVGILTVALCTLALAGHGRR